MKYVNCRVIVAAIVIALSASSAHTLKLTADTTLYIDCTNGSNQWRDPTTPALAFKTLEYAATYLYSEIDVDGWTLTWQIADGVCDASNGNARGMIFAGLVKGQGVQRPGASASELRIQGNVNNWSAVIIRTNSWPGPFFSSTGACIWVQHLSVEALAPNTNGVEAIWNGLIFVRAVVFRNAHTAMWKAHLGGYVEASDLIAIAGDAIAFGAVGTKGNGYIKPVQVIVATNPSTGNYPVFSSGFFNLSTGGTIQNSGTYQGGPASGAAYVGTSQTELVGASNFPSGLSAPSIETGMRLQ